MATRTPFAIDLERPLPELLREVMTDIEEQYIRKALKKSHGNIGRCAKLSGLSRRTITDKVATYKIDRKEFQAYVAKEAEKNKAAAKQP